MVNEDKSSSLKEMYKMQGVVKELFTSSTILVINMIYRLSITLYLGTLHYIPCCALEEWIIINTVNYLIHHILYSYLYAKDVWVKFSYT